MFSSIVTPSSHDKFKAYLNKGVNIYDGTTSTMELIKAVDPSQIKKGTPPSGYTVATHFAKNPGATALTSGPLSASSLTIFWRPEAENGFSKARIFHEGIHGFGASVNGGKLGDYGDVEIQKLFGLTIDPINTANITTYIDDNCFH